MQELYIAAVESQDPVMLQTFFPTTPKTIKGPDGKDYPNPKKDLHLLTAVSCEPKYFKGEPEYRWDAIGRDKSLVPYIKGDLRGLAKSVKFAA